MDREIPAISLLRSLIYSYFCPSIDDRFPYQYLNCFNTSSHALADINRLNSQGHNIRAGVASKTDEPDWADMCMDHLVIEDGTTLKTCFGNLIEIAFSNKTQHFQRLHRKTGIPYENMVFFDNEYGNIRSVSSLGVHCIYTPNGMERKHWNEATQAFGM